MSEWQANLNISDYRASKIIWNDTKPEPISWDMNIGNLIFYVCVGFWVGGLCVDDRGGLGANSAAEIKPFLVHLLISPEKAFNKQ